MKKIVGYLLIAHAVFWTYYFAPMMSITAKSFYYSKIASDESRDKWLTSLGPHLDEKTSRVPASQPQ